MFENLEQSRRGESGRESPMMSMTVMLFFAEMRHFWIISDRADWFTEVVNARPCVARKGFVGPGGFGGLIPRWIVNGTFIELFKGVDVVADFRGVYGGWEGVVVLC